MPRSRFVIFLAITFGITIPLFYFSTLQTSTLLVVAVWLVGSYIPALSAWIATIHDEPIAKEEFIQRLKIRANVSWFGFALLMPTGIWLLLFGVSALLQNRSQPAWLALAALPMIFLVNSGEEIGWRGYALPYLMKRFTPFAASLIVGVIWALFHAALYWQRPIFGLLASASIILMSVILAWLFVNTNSIWPGTLLHATFNTWTQVFVTPGREFLLGISILFTALVVGVLFIRYREDFLRS